MVLGCATLPSGKQLQLVGYQLGERSTQLCIDTVDVSDGSASGCGNDRVLGGGAIDATARTGATPSNTRIAGATSGAVGRVVIRYELDGKLRRSEARLVRVVDRQLLRTLQVSRPFGRYLAEVPRGARAVHALAFDTRGRRIGIAAFEHLGGPQREGRACYSLLRITRVGLLGPRRRRAGATVVVHVAYPNGRLLGVNAGYLGRGIIADLVPTTDAEQRITLPVRLPDRRTAVFEVGADGRPRDAQRCGGELRHAQPKTLVVRLRSR